MGPAIDLTNGNPLLKAMDPEKLRALAGLPPSAPAAPAAPAPIVDASKRGPILPIAPTPQAQMAEAPPTLRTSGPIPSPASSGRDTHLESLMPSPTAAQNAIAPPAYERGTLGGEQSEMNRLATSGSGISQIKSPWARIPLQIADALGRGLFPGIEMGIPGTEGHHQVLMGQERGRIKDIESGQDEAAKRAQEEAMARHTNAQAEDLENPRPPEPKFGPPVATSKGLATYNQNTGEGAPFTVDGEQAQPAEKQFAPRQITPFSEWRAANPDKPVEEWMQHVSTVKPKNRDDAYMETLAKAALGQPITPEEAAQKKAFEGWVRTKMTDPGVARMMALAQGRPVQIVGQNGAVNYDFAGHAIATGAETPGSIPFQYEKGQQMAELPTAASRQMAQMAQTVTPQIQAVSSQVDRLKDKLGPGAGRWNEFWVNKGGLNDPDFANLDQNLDLLASAIVRTHFGASGGQEYRLALRKSFGEAQSPEDLKARIAAADGWVSGYAHMAGQKGQHPQPQGGGATTGEPKPGDVRPGDDGNYKFKGGNWRDKNSWEKVP